MKVIGILGSSSSDSLTRRGMQVVAAQILAEGMEFDLIDLRSTYHGLQKISDYSAPPSDSQTAQLRARIGEARAVVLATPVYHGSFSGLLKNALDQLVSNSFTRLPVGILAAGGGARSASVACDHLRTVVRALGGWSTPTHVGMTYSDFQEEIPSTDLTGRVASMVAELKSFPT